MTFTGKTFFFAYLLFTFHLYGASDQGKHILRAVLHSTQYTVHSTQYTVHSTQYTVHSTQYTVHSTQYTVHSTQYTVHSTQYTVHSTQYTVHSTQYTVHSTQYTVHSTQYTVHSTQYTVHSTQYTVHPPSAGKHSITVRTSTTQTTLVAQEPHIKQKLTKAIYTVYTRKKPSLREAWWCNNTWPHMCPPTKHQPAGATKNPHNHTNQITQPADSRGFAHLHPPTSLSTTPTR